MQLRRCFITWNNWQEDFITGGNIEVYDYFANLPDVKYFVIGFEVGEQGTHHLQAVIGFQTPKEFTTLRKYFKNNHIEKIISLNNALQYCKKDNNFIEFGEVVEERQRTDVSQFVEAIKDGYTNLQLMEKFPNQYLRFYSMIQKIRQEYNYEKFKKEIRDLNVIYIGGASGIGKTRYVYDKFGFEDVYRVTDYQHPFDNYQGQPILVLEEFRSSMKINQILNVLDIYPYMLPSRYENKVACYHTVFIITNIPLSAQYDILQQFEPESVKAFNRRIHYNVFLYHDTYEKEIQDLNYYLETKKDRRLPF